MGEKGRSRDVEDNYFKIEGPSLGEIRASRRGIATLPERALTAQMRPSPARLLPDPP